MAVFYIQCDWQEVLKDFENEGKAWITFKKRGQKGQRAFLKPMPDNSDDPNRPCLSVTSQDFQISHIREKSLVVNVKGQEMTFKVVAPSETYNSIHTKSVS
jgi:hypothetical protein